jgi:hypothetical protein
MRLYRSCGFRLCVANLLNNQTSFYFWRCYGTIVCPINPLVRTEGRDGACMYFAVLGQHAQSQCHITLSKGTNTPARAEGDKRKNACARLQPKRRTFLRISRTEITITDKLNRDLHSSRYLREQLKLLEHFGVARRFWKR